MAHGGEEMSDWIDVREQLPEPGQYVLAVQQYDVKGRIDVGIAQANDLDERDEYGVFWFIEQDCASFERIEHSGIVRFWKPFDLDWKSLPRWSEADFKDWNRRQKRREIEALQAELEDDE